MSRQMKALQQHNDQNVESWSQYTGLFKANPKRSRQSLSILNGILALWAYAASKISHDTLQYFLNSVSGQACRRRTYLMPAAAARILNFWDILEIGSYRRLFGNCKPVTGSRISNAVQVNDRCCANLVSMN